MNTLLVTLLICVSLTSANLTKFLGQCANKTDSLTCLKLQSLKILDRAVHSKSIKLLDGVSLIGHNSGTSHVLNSLKLEKLSSDEVNDMLKTTLARFLATHKLSVKIPKILEEARRRKGGRGGWGALLVALAIKGSFLSMAYQGIAVMSGTAIIVGKLALLLSAILGLKKLVSTDQEQTTIEIVKVPKHSEKHTQSISYEDDHHRAFIDEFGRHVEQKF